MINLMYVLLMAMLALNVSKDVLNGFTVVEDSLNRTMANAMHENSNIYRDFAAQAKDNPAKVQVWYNKAVEVKKMSDSLYNYAQQLKLAIAREADGPDADLQHLVNKANEDAASHVMLAPVRGQGHKLYNAINSFRTRVCRMLINPRDRATVEANLSTTVPRSPGIPLNRKWEEYTFGNMPAVAAIMMLTKLQNDVRLAEGQVLHSLLSNIDLKDVRVNSLDAYVIPEATTLYPGQQFRSRIIMAAVDTTRRPEIYVNGRRISANGTYNFSVGGPGEYSFSGYVQMPNAAGEMIRRPFRQKYNVIAPPSGAAVAADLMNVLYAGINNPISISVPGVAQNAVSATMTNGSLTRSGDHWNAHPTRVGAECVITVTATLEGRSQTVSTSTFRVRKLPDPTAYIAYKDSKGNENHYKGSKPFAKSLLLAANGLDAAIDDDLLNVHYSVVDFETIVFDSMGNAMPEKSAGSRFSERQKTSFRRLSRGKRFYITRIRAKGPDGIVRDLSPMEVIVN